MDQLLTTAIGSNVAGTGLMVVGIVFGVKLTIETVQKISTIITAGTKKESSGDSLNAEKMRALLKESQACNVPCSSHNDLMQKTTEMVVLQRSNIAVVADLANRTDKFFDDTYDRVRKVEERVGSVEGDIKSINARIHS